MRFEDVEETLPNGFHDIGIRGIDVDFEDRSIRIAMNLDVSVKGDVTAGYRRGTLRLNQPYFFFLEPPDPGSRFIPNGNDVNASSFRVKPGEDSKVDALLARIPTNATAFGFFLDDWNSYLYLAGADVEFSWND